MAKNFVSPDAKLATGAREVGGDLQSACEAALKEAIRGERAAKALDVSRGHDGIWTSGDSRHFQGGTP